MSARHTRRTDGRYSFTARLERPDGTIRRSFFYGRTQAEAKAKAAAARERVARGEPVRDATRTVSDWFAEWRTTFLRASDRAESTKDLYAGLEVGHRGGSRCWYTHLATRPLVSASPMTSHLLVSGSAVKG